VAGTLRVPLPRQQGVRMQPFWLNVVLNRIPQALTDGIVLADGFDDSNHERAPDDLQYALLARATADSAEEAASNVRDSMAEYDPIAVSIIADKPRLCPKTS